VCIKNESGSAASLQRSDQRTIAPIYGSVELATLSLHRIFTRPVIVQFCPQ
jgi:hypothetical protein